MWCHQLQLHTGDAQCKLCCSIFTILKLGASALNELYPGKILQDRRRNRIIYNSVISSSILRLHQEQEIMEFSLANINPTFKCLQVEPIGQWTGRFGKKNKG